MPPSTRRPSREHDVVLIGATGFAGRLTAEYLARHAPRELRWALAGRNRDKLENVRAGLATIDPGLSTLPLISADVTDAGSLAALATSTRIVATTVGPYVLHGDAVVAACAAAGTDYLDLTGEPEFVDRSYVRHHREAQDSGARLIHTAGFDSIPHDLGVWFTVQQLPADVPLQISGYVRAAGTVSGGTFASALTAFSRPRQNMAAARERKALDAPTDERRARAVTGRPHRDPVAGGWAVPLPTIDPQVVARSARALSRYGPDFTYSHFASLPHLYTAAGGALGVGALFALAQVPPARRALQKRLAPGDGPSAARRAKSWFTVTFVGERRIKGVELGFNGNITEKWNIYGGYTYLDAKIVDGGSTILTAAAVGAQAAKTISVASVDTGREFPQTAKHSFTLFTNYKIIPRLEIGGGAIYSSRVFGGYADNRYAVQNAAGVVTVVPATAIIARSVPSYWRFDARAAFKVNDQIDIAANLQNLTDKRYFSAAYTSHYALLAPGRTGFVTLNVKY